MPWTLPRRDISHSIWRVKRTAKSYSTYQSLIPWFSLSKNFIIDMSDTTEGSQLNKLNNGRHVKSFLQKYAYPKAYWQGGPRPERHTIFRIDKKGWCIVWWTMRASKCSCAVVLSSPLWNFADPWLGRCKDLLKSDRKNGRSWLWGTSCKKHLSLHVWCKIVSKNSSDSAHTQTFLNSMDIHSFQSHILANDYIHTCSEASIITKYWCFLFETYFGYDRDVFLQW